MILLTEIVCLLRSSEKVWFHIMGTEFMMKVSPASTWYQHTKTARRCKALEYNKFFLPDRERGHKVLSYGVYAFVYLQWKPPSDQRQPTFHDEPSRPHPPQLCGQDAAKPTLKNKKNKKKKFKDRFLFSSEFSTIASLQGLINVG